MKKTEIILYATISLIGLYLGCVWATQNGGFIIFVAAVLIGLVYLLYHKN